jgi:acetyl-CoA C-acetyltransferase
MSATLIVYAKRTPVGKLSGALAASSATQLAVPLVKDAISATGLKPESVDEIIMGCVLPAGLGQAPARQVALHGGLPRSVCATTINRVCGSGLKAIMLADQAIRGGDAAVIFAGGMESMSQAPHLLQGSRAGYKFGAITMQDHMQLDGLVDPYQQKAMGNFGDQCAKEFHFSREAQDQFAVASYERARQAIANKHFSQEIVAIEIPGKKGATLVDQDEQPLSIDLARLPTLKAAFEKDGSVTAGNASSLSDGAALTVLMSASAAAAQGIKGIAKIVAHASHAQAPEWFTTAPVECIRKVLVKAKLQSSDIDLFEINEAFAVVPMAAIKELKLDPAKVNVHGGAIALGHPLGASGTRVLVTLINALRAAGKKRGLATLCIGGGEASAVIIEML